jgi:flavin reductase (DIM6/NTAB) family NADH-FMN oxidoreductase RutF
MSVSDQFKAALASWASGVTVVTVGTDAGTYGITASSFSSVSYDPPTILVCIGNHSPILPMIEQANGFAVNILGRDQEDTSNHFASRGREVSPNLDGFPHRATASGQPALEGALAQIDCSLHAIHDGDDHRIVVGRVLGAQTQQEGQPLLYWSRSYRSLDLS